MKGTNTGYKSSSHSSDKEDGELSSLSDQVNEAAGAAAGNQLGSS